MARRSSVKSEVRKLPAWRGLSSSQQDLLLAVALQVPSLPFAWVDSLAAEDGDVDHLLGQGLLREESGNLVPGEGVRPMDVHESASWAQRRRLHLFLANACEASTGRLEEAGSHYRAAGREVEASRCYLAAGEMACRRHHHRVALRCLTEGFRLMKASIPDEIVIRAVNSIERCALLAATATEAIVLLQEWRYLPTWSERHAVQVAAGLALAALLAREGKNVESAGERLTASARLCELDRQAEAATAALAAAETLTYSAVYLKAREAVAVAIRAAQEAGDPELIARSALLHGLILGMLGETEAGRNEIERCLEIALHEQLTGVAAEAYRLLGTVAEYASCYEDEATAFKTALTFCHRHEQNLTAGMCLGCLAYSYFRAGDWKRSQTTARQVVRQEKIPEFSCSIAECVLGLLAAYRGEIRQAARYLQLSLERTRRLGLQAMDFFNLHGLAIVAEAKGQVDVAGDLYASLLERWRASDDRHDAITGLSWAVVFFADLQRGDEAVASAEALERIASVTANPEAKGAALMAAGELLCLEGHGGRGVKSLREAVATYDRRSLSVEPIIARMRLAKALHADGSYEEAEDWLNECRKQARKLGARTLLVRSDLIGKSQSISLGSSSSPDDPATWDLLSARQREVARQLTRGRTNKEIAEHLSVSVRTVDMHVAHILKRLDCRTRSEAAARVTAALG